MKRQMVLGCCLAVALLAGCGGKTENYKKAEKALEIEDYEFALEYYEASIASGVKTQKSYWGAGIAELHLGNYEKAVEYFGQAFVGGSLSEEEKRTLLQYEATAYYRMGDYSNAMACCQDLLEYPMDEQSHFLSGLTALTLNSYDEAERHFQNAVRLDPTYEMAFRIYNAYQKKGMYANSIEYLEQALEIEPSSAEDYCLRGRCYYYMEQYPQALEELNKAVEMGSEEAFLFMGEIYRAQGDLAQAREMYQKETVQEKFAARAYNALAICDIQEGNYSSALENIRVGLTYKDLYLTQDLLFNEIVVYEKMLDFDTAYQKIQEYVISYPRDEQGQKEFLFLKSRLEEANQTSSRTERIAAENGETIDSSVQDETVTYDTSASDESASDTFVYDESVYDESAYDWSSYDTYGYDYSAYGW